MTNIKNTGGYVGLSRIFFFTDEAKFVSAGIFSSDDRISTGKYESENLFDFDDTKYNGQPMLQTIFEHIPYKFGRIKLSSGHPHEKIFISTDPNIPIDEIYHQTSSGDLIIFGTPLKSKPETIVDNLGELKIWEIKPHINRSDMQNLIRKMDIVSTYKSNMLDSETKAHQYANEAFLQTSRAIASEATNVLFGDKINVLLKQLEIAVEQVINMKIFTNAKLQKGINQIEGALDINVSWDNINDNEIQKWVKDTQADINFLTALKNQNPDPNESVKEYAWNLAIDVCGMDFIKNKLNVGVEQKEINTIGGLSTEYIKRANEARQSPESTVNGMRDMVESIRQEYLSNGNDIDQAVSTIKKNNHLGSQTVPLSTPAVVNQ